MEWLSYDNSYLDIVNVLGAKNAYMNTKCHSINHSLYPAHSQVLWLAILSIFSTLYMIEQICGAINWSCRVAYLFDKAMIDQAVSTQNEPSVCPGAGPYRGQCNSVQVYLSAWCRLIVKWAGVIHCLVTVTDEWPRCVWLSVHLGEVPLWGKADKRIQNQHTASGLVIGRTHHD